MERPRFFSPPSPRLATAKSAALDMFGALSALVAQGTVDARALQPSPGPLAHGPRQSPAPLKRPAHADVKEPRVKPSHPDTAAELHWTLSSRGCLGTSPAYLDL